MEIWAVKLQRDGYKISMIFSKNENYSTYFVNRHSVELSKATKSDVQYST